MMFDLGIINVVKGTAATVVRFICGCRLYIWWDLYMEQPVHCAEDGHVLRVNR